VFQVGEKDKAATGDGSKLGVSEKRKAEDGEPNKDLKKVGVEDSLTRSGNGASMNKDIVRILILVPRGDLGRACN